MTSELSKSAPSSAHRQARDRFDQTGQSIQEWSEERGFDARLVRVILSEGRPCRRGESHRIAVALGLKPSATADSASF